VEDVPAIRGKGDTDKGSIRVQNGESVAKILVQFVQTTRKSFGTWTQNPWHERGKAGKDGRKSRGITEACLSAHADPMWFYIRSKLLLFRH
jgi:hypothetical protein